MGTVAAVAFAGFAAQAGLATLEAPVVTISGPPPPVATVYDTAPASAHDAAPAAAFRMAGSALDRSRALECLTTAIYYEAATEPDDGQRAVAQVILNRVRHPAFPVTVCGVVYQGSDRTVCQFSFACDGAMLRPPASVAWRRAQRAAAAALYGPAFAPVGLATHYHTYAVTPAWNRSLVMTGVHGAHFFHRQKGRWGTAAAFTDRYRGGEPVPGPLARVTTPDPSPPAPIAVADIIAADPVESPGHSGVPAMTALPDAPQILDRWRDTGKPIR